MGLELPVLGLVIVAVATLAGAAIQGAIGFGMNLVAVPVLALVAPESLPVAAILLGVPISVTMLRYELGALDRAGFGWILVGRIPGIAVGTWVVATMTTASLQVAVGAFVLLFVVASAVVPPLPVRPSTQVVAGAVSGVTGTATGIGGPPLALLYQHHTGPVIRATLAAAFFAGTLLSFGALAIGGQVERDQVVVGLLLAPAVAIGGVAGRRLHDLLDRGWMRPAVLGFAAVSAAIVLVDGLL